ncbi:metal ABC transporter ATP-binding protein [soil metagenome]
MTALAVRGLTVSYRGRAALRGASVAVAAGERLGVVGPNGAGKSTLLRAVVGLVRPDAGEVEVEGLPAARARRRVAYLPQRQQVDWDYPAQVRDIVAMGRYPHRGPLGRLRPADRRAVGAALERVGLSELGTARIGELSGGQQQRTFLARAFAQEASVLLLDEPYVGIDAVTSKLIDRWLGEAAAEGAAVVVVDHELAGVRERYDRVLVLNRQVVIVAAPDHALADDVLGAAYGRGAVLSRGGGP